MKPVQLFTTQKEIEGLVQAAIASGATSYRFRYSGNPRLLVARRNCKTPRWAMEQIPARNNMFIYLGAFDSITLPEAIKMMQKRTRAMLREANKKKPEPTQPTLPIPAPAPENIDMARILGHIDATAKAQTREIVTLISARLAHELREILG